MKVYGELQRAQFENLAADPTGAGLVTGRKWHNTTEKKVKFYDGTSVIELGAGAGGINYCGNSDFEASVSNYNLYADAAGVKPVDGQDGTTTGLAFTRTTTTAEILRGVASAKLAKTTTTNLQGFGVSIDLDLFPLADLSSVMQVTFDYDASHAGYADDDMRVYIISSNDSFVSDYNVIEPQGAELKAGKGSHFCTFQTDATDQEYRLCFHLASTSAVDYDVFLDNISVSPIQTHPSAVAVSDWKDYDPNLLNFALDTADGNYRSQYRRVGDSVDIRIYGSIQTNPTGIIGFTLPDGLSMVDRISSRDVYGVVKGFDGGSNAHLGMVSSGSGTTFNVSGDDGTAHWNATTPFTWSAGSDYFSVNVYGIPIQGWSSNSQDVAVVDDNRIVAMSADSYAGAAISNTAEGDLTFTTSSETHSNFATGTGIYTIGTSGWYQVSANTGLQVSSPTAGNKGQLLLYKNGSTLIGECQQEAESSSTNTFFSHHVSISAVYLLKGETLKTSYANNWGESVSLQGNARTNFSVSKISGQNQIIADESILVRATTNAGDSYGTSWAALIYEDVDVNSHGAYNSTTGIFTAPYSSTFKIRGTYSLASLNNGDDMFIGISKNSAATPLHATSRFRNESGSVIAKSISTSDSIPLLKGETLEIRIRLDSTESLEADGAYNVITIEKVGR